MASQSLTDLCCRRKTRREYR